MDAGLEWFVYLVKSANGIRTTAEYAINALLGSRPLLKWPVKPWIIMMLNSNTDD